MKTSNKLLIALASALIIMPIVCVAIYSKIYYISAEDYQKNNQSFEKLESQTEGYTTKKISQKINSITIKGFNTLNVNVHVVESEHTGVKFEEELGSDFVYHTDDKGLLSIEIKPNKKQYSQIYIYAPNVVKINTEQLANLDLAIKVDSLEIVAKKTSQFNLQSAFKVQNLTLTATDSTNVNLDQVGLINLSAKLENAQLESRSTSYKKLNIVSYGSSFVQLANIDNEKKLVNIDAFNLETYGAGSVNLSNLKVNQMTGKLSDETTIISPYKYLKNLK